MGLGWLRGVDIDGCQNYDPLLGAHTEEDIDIDRGIYRYGCRYGYRFDMVDRDIGIDIDV